MYQTVRKGTKRGLYHRIIGTDVLDEVCHEP